MRGGTVNEREVPIVHDVLARPLESERAARPVPPGHEGFRLVVVATSLGGLQALSCILAALPASFGAAIAVVQHRAPSSPLLLGELLRQRTSLRVKDAEDNDEIAPGVVFLAPPGIHLVVAANGRFALKQGAKVKFARPSGDVLFKSAAEALTSRVIAVVLTGGDGDGADGVTAVKRHGGTVVVQDAESAEAPSMPLSAMRTGDVDYVRPLEEIAGTLKALMLRGPRTGQKAAAHG